MGSLALLNDGVVVASTAGEEAKPSRAEELLTAIGYLLKRVGTRLEDLNLIAVSTGPGSYSGIRIGIATALGLKRSLNIPCVGISVLHAMALSASVSRNVVCAVAVGKKDVAWQLYSSGEEFGPPELSSETDFVGKLPGYADCTLYLHSELLARLNDNELVKIHTVVDAGRRLSEMIGRAVTSGNGEEWLRPLYLRNQMHAGSSAGF